MFMVLKEIKELIITTKRMKNHVANKQPEIKSEQMDQKKNN